MKQQASVLWPLYLLLALLGLSACNFSEGQSQAASELDMSGLRLQNTQNQGADKALDMRQLRLQSPPASSAAPVFPTDASRTRYRCPMHPQVVQQEPGNCPICGMALEASDVSAASGGGSDLQERALVQINHTRQQLIGVQTAAIRSGQASQSLRAVARIVRNEKLLHHEHSKYDGWVEKLHADFVGKYVRKGQPLADIYSPELVAAQEEYLLALRSVQHFADSGFESSQQASQQVLAAAERKLQRFDMTPAQIARLRDSGQVQRRVTLFASGSGYITELEARHGMRITAGTTLFSLASQASVWVLAQVYENELNAVYVGQPAEVTLPFLPGKRFRGQVEYIDPVLDAQTRTASVRLVLPNPDGQLKPEMFAHVHFQRQLSGSRRLLPASALLDNGQQQWVFVAEGEGRFRPVRVKTGQRFGEDYELLEGPAPGTQVVIQAQFLIDSESQLQAALARLGGAGAGHAAHAAPTTPAAPSKNTPKHISNVPAEHSGHAGH
ncbi:MAG: efflux RND transporter periplasmic adaptor subunit [Candidatus Sericytochromatia bacterium]|nr:efflux RND transporter periplasmic adaptor subunit [Candidatus Sericytochromatia bacterium]